MAHFISLLIFLLGAVVACTTSPPPQPEPSLPKSRASYVTRDKRNYKRYNDLDQEALMRELGLPPSRRLGFQERVFNTCQIRSNRSKQPFCQVLYASRLNFQMLCRHSKGTVSRVHLTPLTSRRLRWKNYQTRGQAATNSQGFGSISFITKRPSRKGHLYMYLDSKVARKRFEDQWKLVLPESWCLNP